MIFIASNGWGNDVCPSIEEKELLKLLLNEDFFLIQLRFLRTAQFGKVVLPHLKSFLLK